MKKRNRIPRRDFLASSLCSASLLVPGVLSAGRGERVFGDRKAVGIGYWDGSESLESFECLRHVAEGSWDDGAIGEDAAADSHELQTQRIVDARTLPRGDHRFATRGATIRLHGVCEAHRIRFDELASLGIYVHPRPFGSVPFLAWALDSGPVRQVSSPSRFEVPVERTPGLMLSFDVRGNGERNTPELTPVDHGFGEDHIFARFALDGARGAPKLRRGVYLVAWSATGPGMLPEWSRYGVEVPQRTIDQIEGSGGVCEAPSSEDVPSRPTRLVRRRGGPEKFAYVVLSVDFAGQRETPPESLV